MNGRNLDAVAFRVPYQGHLAWYSWGFPRSLQLWSTHVPPTGARLNSETNGLRVLYKPTEDVWVILMRENFPVSRYTGVHVHRHLHGTSYIIAQLLFYTNQINMFMCKFVVLSPLVWKRTCELNDLQVGTQTIIFLSTILKENR